MVKMGKANSHLKTAGFNKIKKTKGNRILKDAVCDSPLFLGCSEKYEVAKQLLHPKGCSLIFSDIIPYSKRSQAWGVDLMIAFIIFTIGIFIFYLYALNDPQEGELKIESLHYDGSIIGQSILSEGYPKDWNYTNVVTIGIVSNDKINQTKLERFFNLTATNYTRTRRLFNTPYHYYFMLAENMTIGSNSVEGLGLKPTTTKNLIKITRFTVYNDKPLAAYVYVWE